MHNQTSNAGRWFGAAAAAPGWSGLLAVGVVVAAWLTALLLGRGEPALVVSDVGLAVASALAAVAYLRAARRWSARYRAHAQLMAAACASWSAGQIIWSYLELGRDHDTPFPSLADVGYLGLMPFAIAAVLTVPLQKDRFNRVKLLLDGLIIAGSLLVIGWTLVLSSVVHNPADTELGQVITLAYPVGDIVIVTFALSQQSRLLRRGSQSRAFAFTIAGLMGLWVADMVFAYLTAIGQYQSGQVEDSGWFVGFLLLCVAAMQPSPAPPAPAAAAPPPRRAAAGLPYLVAIAAVLITAAVGLPQRQPNVVGIAILLVTMTFLAVRQYLSTISQHDWIRELEKQVGERTAEVRRGAEKLRASEERFRAVVHNLSDVILLVGKDGRIHYQTPSVRCVLGYPPGRQHGTALLGLVHPDNRAAVRQALDTASPGPAGAMTLEAGLLHQDGSYRGCQVVITNLLSDPALDAVVVNIRDISERQRLERELTHLAFHDALTGLPNRELLGDRLATALAQRRRVGSHLAVVYVDLDDFKSVNDSLGHQVGDRLLVAVAGRLQECVRPGDTVGRLGGDEFAVIIPDLPDGDVEALADRLAHSLRQPHHLHGREMFVAASVGVAVAADRDSADTLLSNADLAMYRAKSLGLGRRYTYHASMRKAMVDRISLEAELHHALDRGELALHYQPTIDLATDTVVGAEALIRWNHPSEGLLPPAGFIPAAEQSALIVELGRWALREACQQGARWQPAKPTSCARFVAVNLSARHLSHPGLVNDVAEALARSGLPPGCLVVEITESVLVAHIEQNLDEKLAALKGLGVRIALDDFGTGYSALSHLQRFPVDTLKIDQSFVRNVRRAQPQSLATAIIRLGQALALDTVAEGVESIEQLDVLKTAGCSHAQGFHLYPPLQPSEACNIIDAKSARAGPAHPAQPHVMACPLPPGQVSYLSS